MNRELFAAILILVGYLYGSTLYDPWYFMVQRGLLALGLIKMPPDAPEGTKLIGNQVQIIMSAIVLIGAGIWLFVLSAN